LLDGARKAHSRFDDAKIFWKLPRQRDLSQLPSR